MKPLAIPKEKKTYGIDNVFESVCGDILDIDGRKFICNVPPHDSTLRHQCGIGMFTVFWEYDEDLGKAIIVFPCKED